MSKFRLAFCLLPVLALPALAGCAAVAVGGVAAAGAGAGYAAGQERGVTGTVNDLKIENDIAAAWQNANPPLAGSVTATAYEGRVLLTGTLPSARERAEAGAVARGVPGVRVVYDEIAVGPGETTWDAARDAWISARLRSDLVLDSDVRSVNYDIETVNGTVYLLGSARDPAELARVTHAARYLPAVRRVVSFVTIRPGAPALAAISPPPPVRTEPPPAVPPAVPPVPVEVHKL